MEQRKSKKIRRRASEALNDDDRLSRLPDSLIHHIFSFMDTRYAVQSSVLSRNWRDTWKSQPQLSTEIIRSLDRASGSKFPNFVHKFLSRRDASAELSTIEFQSNFIGLPLLREIIAYAMSHKTRKLKIEFSGDKGTRRGELDASLFRSRQLEQLFLSIEFYLIPSPLTMDFPALTTLNISHVNFLSNDGSKSNDFFSQFPNLKTLALDGCWLYLKTFIIKSSKLETLSLLNLSHISCTFVVLAPKLSSFTYKGSGRFSLSAKDLVSLKTVCLQITKEPEVTDWMNTLISQLCMAESLTLNLYVFKGLSDFPELLETRNCPFTSLQSLTMLSHHFPLSFAAFDGVLNYFRRSSPDLEIHIEHDPTQRPVYNW